MYVICRSFCSWICLFFLVWIVVVSEFLFFSSSEVIHKQFQHFFKDRVDAHYVFYFFSSLSTFLQSLSFFLKTWETHSFFLEYSICSCLIFLWQMLGFLVFSWLGRNPSCSNPFSKFGFLYSYIPGSTSHWNPPASVSFKEYQVLFWRPGHTEFLLRTSLSPNCLQRTQGFLL